MVDGVPACAVQEERLSRHKNDAAFPEAAIEWCLNQAAVDPEDLDAVVFYERSMLKFERILTCTLRAFPRSWRSFPDGDEEHARREGLGSRHHLVTSRRAQRSKILFTRHHESHAAAAFLTAPTQAGGDSDR